MNLLKKITVLLIIIFSTSGCASTIEKLQNVGKAPQLNAVDHPINKPTYQPVEWPDDKDRNPDELLSKNNNSLWKPGSRGFFRDQHARNIGDIVKVVIKIEDKADLNNKTQQTRNDNDSIAAPKVFGFERKFRNVWPEAVDPTELASVTGSNSHAGEGKITRKETLKTQVAAMVTQILPNGSLVISGKQEIRVNYELREITIDGIVRPEDISSDNSVSLEQIAEARVSYGGRGRISDVQQPRYGSQLLDIISPF